MVKARETTFESVRSTVAAHYEVSGGDLVGQMSAGHAFTANLAVFKTHDAMTGALLDALA